MKKIVLTLLLAGSITAIGSTQALADTNKQQSNNVVSVGEQTKENNLISYSMGTNKFSDISSAKGTEFDKPSATESGILLKMNDTTIETKYGKMQIVNEGENKGYKVTNLTNPKAPVLTVGVVNNIYEVGNQVDLKGLIAPVLYNSAGARIKGNIIFPSIDTSKPSYGETYIEASDGAGNITVAPFIYNVVSFKSSINVPKGFNVQDLSVKDILSGGEGNLRSYVAHYDTGSDKIIVGVSRGVASIRKEIPITFGEEASNKPAPEVKKDVTAKQEVTPKKVEHTEYEVPLLMKIFVNPITYIVIGVLLIALIWFLCF
ncbi:MAG: hypothetical protein ACRC6T_11935 [Sarcina sp.]